MDSQVLDGLREYAAFISEDEGIDIEKSMPLAGFMLMARHLRFVCAPVVWVGHGKERVYFEGWSQNNLPAIECEERYYFDPALFELVVVQHIYGRREIRLGSKLKRKFAIYSGAKTRDALFEAIEGVEWLKSHLASMS